MTSNLVKISKKLSTLFRKSQGNTLYTGKICNPRTKPFSADELARQTKFRQAIAAVNALTEEQKATYAVVIQTKTVETYDASKKGL